MNNPLLKLLARAIAGQVIRQAMAQTQAVKAKHAT